jgi:hypothetical protein
MILAGTPKSPKGKIRIPTLRKEREGWGTRQLVSGVEKKALIPPSTIQACV